MALRVFVRRTNLPVKTHKYVSLYAYFMARAVQMYRYIGLYLDTYIRIFHDTCSDMFSANPFTFLCQSTHTQAINARSSCEHPAALPDAATSADSPPAAAAGDVARCKSCCIAAARLSHSPAWQDVWGEGGGGEGGGVCVWVVRVWCVCVCVCVFVFLCVGVCLCVCVCVLSLSLTCACKDVEATQHSTPIRSNAVRNALASIIASICPWASWELWDAFQCAQRERAHARERGCV
jgi:hypothetical protein